MPSMNKDSFISLLQICIPPLFCVISLTRTFNTMLKSSDIKGHLFLIPDLSWKALIFWQVKH